MTVEEEKKLQQQTMATRPTTAPAGPNVAGLVDQYVQRVGNGQKLTGGHVARTRSDPNQFSYDLDGDALYQQYRDRYIQNARRSMKDTMGQAAGLTGGYGSTYSQAAGQQAYDETMRGLTDLIPTLQQNAYGMWKDKQSLIQQQYGNLSSAILSSGYQPSPDELAAAGMSTEQANALRQAWIAANPGAAYMQGAMTADQYYKLTGQLAPGAAVDAGGTGYGGSGGGGGGTKSLSGTELLRANAESMQSQGASTAEINSYLVNVFQDFGASAQDVKDIRSALGLTSKKK